MKKKKKSKRNTGLSLLVLIILFFGVTLTGIILINLPVAKSITIPVENLEKKTNYVTYEENTLRSMSYVIEQLPNYQITGLKNEIELNPENEIWGEYVAEAINCNIYITSTEDEIKSDIINRIAKKIWLISDSEYVSYEEYQNTQGALDKLGFETVYSAGLLTIEGSITSNDKYIAVMQVKLDSDRKFTVLIATSEKWRLEDGLQCMKDIIYYLTKEQGNQAKEEVKTSIDTEGLSVSMNKVEKFNREYKKAMEIVEQYDELAEEQATIEYPYIKVDGTTQSVKRINEDLSIIKDVNYDYPINLAYNYKCLRVTYNYMDITQKPESIYLVSPDKQQTIYPDETETVYENGIVVFKVPNATEGKWILSVRSSVSLGGAIVDFMEQQVYEDAAPEWTKE